MEAFANGSHPPPEARAPALHSWRFIHSLSNPNHQTGRWFPLLPKPLSERRREKKKKHTTKNKAKPSPSDLSQRCLCVVRAPSPAAQRRGCSGRQSAGLWQVLLFPKRSHQLQHITCGNFSWILNGFWSHAVSCLHVTPLYYDWISCSFYRVVLS